MGHNTDIQTFLTSHEYFYIVTYETGTVLRFSSSTSNVTSGDYDDTTATLTVVDGAFNPVGQVNVLDKSGRGTVTAGNVQFILGHQGEQTNI